VNWATALPCDGRSKVDGCGFYATQRASAGARLAKISGLLMDRIDIHIDCFRSAEPQNNAPSTTPASARSRWPFARSVNLFART